MSFSSRGYSCNMIQDWVLVIGTLPINGHQNAWRAVKDLLKRLLAATGAPVKDQTAAKIQQVHIVETPNGRYAVCRFGQSQQARNAFDWIGGNVWHGARIGAWLYKVGSDWHGSAIQVDSWDTCRVYKNTPLETFWAIGNAFLQRTPTAGPISPVSSSSSPSHQPLMVVPVSPISSSTSEPAAWDECLTDGTAFRSHRIATSKQRKQQTPFHSPVEHDVRSARRFYQTRLTRVPSRVVICNGSDEAVPITTHGRGRDILVG